MIKKIMLVSAGTLAMAVLTAQAEAQTVPPAPPATPDDSATGLGDIVVTAEKRSSTSQRVAASLDVVSGSALARQQVVQLQDLNAVLPSVQLLPFVNSIQVAIRGVQSNFIDPRADPAVAVSVNGLFFDRPLPNGFAFLDVARVEALNGPQGTLYGRNAVGGAINIITNQPTNKFGGMAQASFGNYDERDFIGVVNVPVSNTLAVRAAYARNRRDGYLGGFYDDNHSDTARVSARWQPTDKLTIYAEGDYLHQGGHGAVQEAYPCMGAKPWSLTVPGTSLYIPGVTMPTGCTVFGGGQIAKSGRVGTHIESGQLHVDYDFGFMTASSITGYVGTHQRFYTLPNAVININTTIGNSHDYSEEVRFAGHDQADHAGGLAWQVGAFFFRSTGDFSQTTILAYANPILTMFIGRPSTVTYTALPQSSEAGFAQVTYGLTDRLRATGGVRYTADYKAVQQLGIAKLKEREGHTTYKGGVEYDVSRRNLLYANASSGYLAGGPDGGNPDLPTAANQAPVYFNPETIKAYEIGSKNRFINNRLQINADVYYYNFHNLQITEPATYNTAVAGSTLVVENAGKAKTYGVELNGEFALTPVDHLSASVTWAHGTYGGATFADTPAGVPTTTNIPHGQRLINLPKWVALLGYDHSFKFGNGQALTASVNTKISSSYQLEFGTPIIHAYDTQKAFTMTDASLTYSFDDDRFTLRGWVKNIENSAVNVYGETGGNHVYGILAPRTYGGTMTVNF